jgi:hypothetical protein
MTRFGIDDVNGIVIGDIEITGKLFYDGRQQGNTLHAKDEVELRKLAVIEKERIKSEQGNEFKWLFREDIWELRIYD